MRSRQRFPEIGETLETSSRFSHFALASKLGSNSVFDENIFRFPLPSKEKRKWLLVGQELKDLSLRVAEIAEEGTEADVAAERAEWRAEAAKFWRSQAGETKETPRRPAALQRSKAAKWLFAVDNQLRCVTSKGLEQFALQIFAPSYSLCCASNVLA